MARVYPFQPYRYSRAAGDLNDLVTQPYDKITPSMQAGYLEKSPHNLVRVILGPKQDGDNDSSNVYTRAASYFNDWTAKGLLAKEAEPSFFAYFQEFAVPDSLERLTRKGFIGLGRVEEYSAGVVHRHEQTLSGPKKDRRLVLEHTRAHFGQIFMLYPDEQGEIDAILDKAAKEKPVAEVHDEYDTAHRLYKISDAGTVRRIQEIMDDKKLLIADGHHRYETALGFKHDHPELQDADRVMMTFVNMYSPGLRILATHRVLSGIPDFSPGEFLQKARESFEVRRLASTDELKEALARADESQVRIGFVTGGGADIHLLSHARRKGELDVRILHEQLLAGMLGVSADAVREEKYVKYVRGIDAAVDAVRGGAQVAFVLEPTSIQQVADTSFGGGVMPQKSTDFFPKLLTGLTIYRLEK